MQVFRVNFMNSESSVPLCLNQIIGLEGIVIKSTGSWYSVLSPDGGLTECKLKGRFKVQGIKTTNPLAVGDPFGASLD